MSLRATDSLMRYADEALVCCAGRFSLRLALPRGLRREESGASASRATLRRQGHHRKSALVHRVLGTPFSVVQSTGRK